MNNFSSSEINLLACENGRGGFPKGRESGFSGSTGHGRRSSMRRSGFTLVEMLVVSSIISFLIAVLLPALGKSKETARRSLCVSKLKQWGVAFTIYSDSYKGYYPTMPDNPSYIYNIDSRGKNLMAPFGMSNIHYYCPSNYTALTNPAYKSSYCFAMGITYSGFPTSPKRNDEHMDWVLMADLNLCDNNGIWYEGCVNHLVNAYAPDGTNRLYVDGSARWADFSEMKTRLHSATPNDQWW